MSAKVHDSATTVNGHGSHMKLSVQSNGSANHRISGRNGDDEFSEPDEPVEVIENPDDELRRVAAAKERHEADLLVHHYEAPKADRMQDDWQVAYVWAFIVKFGQLDRIRKLECVEDLERSLLEPVANRPDDVLEGTLIRFLYNLKPGLRNLDCTNIQSHLSNYISDAFLNSSEFTVWDRPWAPNEEVRAGCCNPSTDRHELGRLRYAGEPLAERAGRNPIKQIEQRGGGLFELDWRERAKLLRQLVDWQLALSDPIRSIINRTNKVGESRGSKTVHAPVDSDITIEPLGQDRNKNRIWKFDDSGRLYKSGNPYKRPCPLMTITSNGLETQDLLYKITSHGSQSKPKLKGSGSKGKPTAAEAVAHRKLLKGIEDEKKLAGKLADLMPAVEKEEGRIQRARRKIAAAAELAQLAEERTTRTRRPTRKVDYTYDDDIDVDEAPTKRTRHETTDYAEMSIRRKPFIPGERKSARNARPEVTESSTNGETVSSASDLDPSLGGTQVPMVVLDGSRRSKGMKGYAFVPHERPFEMLTPKEQRSLSDQQVTTANGVTPSTNEHDRDEARMELDSEEATGEGRSSVREESEEEEAIEGVIEAGA